MAVLLTIQFSANGCGTSSGDPRRGDKTANSASSVLESQDLESHVAESQVAESQVAESQVAESQVDKPTRVDRGEAEKTPAIKMASTHLPNLHRLGTKVYFGGQPAGEGGFKQLRDLQINTIISVDGARPNLEAAKKFGLRYVHLPHGYDGISNQRGIELAKAVRDLDGPIYIHCHHGKHRSPAAAVVACVSLNLLRPVEALSVLRTAGTGTSYRGLYHAAETATARSAAELDKFRVDFQETVELPPMAEAMVGIEQSFDRLKTLIADSGAPTASNPDPNSAHEALLLREQFTELLRSETSNEHPAAFLDLIRESEQAAIALEQTLAQSTGFNRRDAERLWGRIESSCTACHHKFRDIPRNEN